MVVVAYIGLGANLGNPTAAIEQAIAALDELPLTVVIAGSSLYRSAPVNCPTPQNDYINAVVKIGTALPSTELLGAMHRIEASAGRQRGPERGSNLPRVLDLDLLLFGDQISSGPELTLPHPRLHQRAFVLLPLLEIEPALVLPALGPAKQWLSQCADQTIERLGQTV